MANPKVLIVDDREFDRILYKEFLTEVNYDFFELDDGAGIIDFLQETIPDIILLDWQMPLVGGMATLKLLKQNNAFREIPVIIITGQKDEKVMDEAFAFGGIDFLNKPVNKIELTARVQNVLNLTNAKKLLIEQKNELQELNSIIKVQKDELKESLVLKTQMSEQREKSLNKEMGIEKRKMMTMEVDSNKIINNLTGIRSDVQEVNKLLVGVDNVPLAVLKKIKSVEREIDSLIEENKSKDKFQELFASIDPEFFKKLSAINSKLTPLDLKHCAYIKMNLDNYELKRVLNVEMKSIQMTRYRLKKKLKLTEDDSLREFIFAI